MSIYRTSRDRNRNNPTGLLQPQSRDNNKYIQPQRQLGVCRRWQRMTTRQTLSLRRNFILLIDCPAQSAFLVNSVNCFKNQLAKIRINQMDCSWTTSPLNPWAAGRNHWDRVVICTDSTWVQPHQLRYQVSEKCINRQTSILHNLSIAC